MDEVIAKVVLEDIYHSPSVEDEVKQSITDMLVQLCPSENETRECTNEPMANTSSSEKKGGVTAARSADSSHICSPSFTKPTADSKLANSDCNISSVRDAQEPMEISADNTVTVHSNTAIGLDYGEVKQCVDEILGKVESENCSAEAGSSENGSSVNSTKSLCATVQTVSKESLMEDCLAALKLCIVRFPLHYKSYYRLAKLYLHDKSYKVGVFITAVARISMYYLCFFLVTS